MLKRFGLMVLMSAVTVAALAQQPQQPVAPRTHLKIGAMAPDFALTDTNGQFVKLSDFRGKRAVVLAFYVLAFTGG